MLPRALLSFSAYWSLAYVSVINKDSEHLNELSLFEFEKAFRRTQIILIQNATNCSIMAQNNKIRVLRMDDVWAKNAVLFVHENVASFTIYVMAVITNQ